MLRHLLPLSLVLPLHADPAPEVIPEMLVTAPHAGAEARAPEPDAFASLAGGRGTVQELLQFRPNMQAGSSLGSIFSLRGLSQEGTPTLGTRSNASIQVLSGAAPRSTNTLWVLGMPEWDTMPLEIRRGPVLFNTAPVSQGGELRLEPNAPVFEHQGLVLGEISDEGSYRAGVTENVVLLPGVLALRLNAFTRTNDGGLTNNAYDDDEFAADERHLFRGQLRWRPAGDERSTIDLLVESEGARGNAMGLVQGDLFRRETSLNTRERSPGDRHAAVLTGDVWLRDDLRLRGEVAWQRMDGLQVGDLDGGDLLRWYFHADGEESRLTGGLRLTQEKDDATWTLGLYAESSDYAMRFDGVGIRPIPTGSPFASVVEEDIEMAAVFLEGEKEIAPGFWLHGGLRLDHQRRSQDSGTTIAGVPVGSGRETTRATEWLPELGLEWRGDRGKAGIALSRLYRPAGGAAATTLGTSEPYGAERGWEVSLHAEHHYDDSLLLTGRLFHGRLQGQQVPYNVTGGLPVLDQFIANAGESTRAGAEIELSWTGPGSLRAALAGGWLYTRYDELVLHGVDRSGQELPAAPEFSASLLFGWLPATGWFGETAFAWSDNSYSQAASPAVTALEKRLLLSARAGYRWQNAEAYVFGSNLLDRDYALIRQDYTGIGRGVEGLPGAPRLVGAGFSLRW